MTVKEEEEEEDEEGLADPRGCQLQKLEDDPLLRVEFRVLPGGGDDVSVERDVVQTAQFCQRETILEEDCARSRRKWKYVSCRLAI